MLLAPRISRFLLAFLFITTNLIHTVRASNILGLFITDHRSHLLVYSAIVRLLLERGHNVTVVSTRDIEEFKNFSSYPQLRRIQLAVNETPIEESALSHLLGIHKIVRVRHRIEEKSSFLNDPKWKEFLQESNSFDLLLLGYLFNDYQLGVAAHFQCPSVVIWTGQPISLIHQLLGNPEERTYVTQAYDRHQRTGKKTWALTAMEMFVDNLALYTMQHIYNKHFPRTQYPSFTQVRKNVSLVLCNHHSLSEGPIAPYLPGLVDIGGIQIDPQAQLATELIPANGSSFILFSFGTREKWSYFPEFLVNEFLDAFKKLPQFTIFWTFDGDCETLMSQAPNIKCAPWWPQTALLANPQLALFITHGGKGSASEIKFHGVPILGIPLRGDQFGNVARLVTQGFGRQLDVRELKATNISAAIEELTTNSSYRVQAQHYAFRYRDRPLSAQQTAIYWIEYVMRHQVAAHLQSARLQLNALQYYLWDVYAALILAVGCFIWICNRCERWLN